MKKQILFALLSILIFAFAAEAQNDYYSSRLSNYADDLKRATVDLADRTSNDLRRGGSNSRSTIEEAFLAAQMDSSAGLFQQMVGDRRSASELRDAAALLNDLARRAPSYGSNSYGWRNVQKALTDINRELGNSGGGNGNGNGNGNGDNRPVIGRVYWRGTVDDKIQLVIRGGQIETRVISGTPYPDGTYSFTANLPNRNVTVDVNKTKGRGSVRVVQQPSKSNEYTTIVEVYDDGGGAKEYQLDIFWR
ncbi:MAG: hypothetical protein JSS81_10395 [Acidobacteria bacterium]|nr:hypothetical protein [Acidobacteriota bacterium]